MAIVKGTAYWASVQEPNTRFPPPEYSIDVVVDEATAEKLRADGLTVRNKEDQGLTFKVKRKQFRKDGTLNTKPNIVDASKQPLEALIGNGSIVNVQYNPFDWNNAFGSGRGADLVGVQVLELVEFSGGNQDEFDPVEGAKESKEESVESEFDEEF